MPLATRDGRGTTRALWTLACTACCLPGRPYLRLWACHAMSAAALTSSAPGLCPRRSEAALPRSCPGLPARRQPARQPDTSLVRWRPHSWARLHAAAVGLQRLPAGRPRPWHHPGSAAAGRLLW